MLRSRVYCGRCKTENVYDPENASWGVPSWVCALCVCKGVSVSNGSISKYSPATGYVVQAIDAISYKAHLTGTIPSSIKKLYHPCNVRHASSATYHLVHVALCIENIFIRPDMSIKCSSTLHGTVDVITSVPTRLLSGQVGHNADSATSVRRYVWRTDDHYHPGPSALPTLI